MIEADGRWALVWSLDVPQRIRMFMCLALHRKVLTNSQGVVRHIAMDPRCHVCGAAEETLDHLFASAILLMSFGSNWVLNTVMGVSGLVLRCRFMRISITEMVRLGQITETSLLWFVVV